jgi:hypothetical protein
VLGGSRQVAADRAELPDADWGTQASGYFLFQLVMRMQRSDPLLPADIRQSVVNRR